MQMSSGKVEEITKMERAEKLERMRVAAKTFYGLAQEAGCHAFLEFTGLLSEYIKICESAEALGIDWIHSNKHGGEALPFEDYNIAYLAEKLDCIYGPALRSSSILAQTFFMDHGAAK